MNDYTIIGEYYPEGNNIVKVTNEGKENVAGGFVAFCVINPTTSIWKYKPALNEKILFKKFKKDKDFQRFLGKKRVRRFKWLFFWYKLLKL